MHLLYCDESNLQERKGDFLIYGGLMVDSEQALALSQAIDDLRARHRVPDDYRFKFNPGPDGLDHFEFIALKEEALRIALHHGARMLAYVILHDIASSSDEARRNGINTVCFHFDCILSRLKSSGIVLIDRFNDEGNAIEAHLREKFTIGLTGLPYSKNMRMNKIVGFHYSAVGQSHLPSLIDVALGSLRFAVNAHTRGQAQHHATAHTLLQLLAPLFWREAQNQPVPELGFLFSPKRVRVDAFRQRYEALKAFLATGGLTTGQTITDQRMY